jgi:hypothetical protein
MMKSYLKRRQIGAAPLFILLGFQLFDGFEGALAGFDVGTLQPPQCA